MEYDLFKELENYTPKNEEENQDLIRIKEFIRTNNNYFSRANAKGHVTAGAMIMHEDGEILINYHKKLNKWIFFGGHSEGETNPLNIAKREVQEETGITEYDDLDGKIQDVSVHRIPEYSLKNEPEHIHYDIMFIFIVKTKEFTISNESIDIKWVSIEEAKKLVTDKDKNRMLDKASEIQKNRSNK